MVKVNQGIVKLDKQECNSVLEYISTIDEEMGLFLKIIYVYGRKVSEISKLKVKDIDVKHGLIDFRLGKNKTCSFGLVSDVKDSVYEQIKDLDSEEFIFSFNSGDVNRKVSRFLDSVVKKINLSNMGVINRHCPSLNGFDFRRLRGQHLFIDGVSLALINMVYLFEDRDSVRNLIKYDELCVALSNCSSIDVLMRDTRFTDLNVFHDTEYHNVDSVVLFTVSCGGVSCVVFEYDCIDSTVSVLEGSDESIVKFVDGLDKSFFDDVLCHLSNGDYKIIDGFKIVKN